MFSLRVLFSRSASSNLQFNLRAVSTSKMAANKRDLGNETEGDDCLKAYKYFYNPELLKGKVAFITGGGSGIGFRIAEIFMRHGCTTAIASRKFERVAEAAKKLTAATDVQCIPIKMDVRDSQQVEFGINSCVTKLKKIDILINCAAGNFLSPIDDLSYNAFKTVMDIDTLGTYNVSKAAYKYYLKNHGGNIINITATLHYRGCIMQCHAGSAKAAIDAMTKHMAVEWGGKTGIRVNALAPGPIAGTVGMNKLGGAMESMKDIIPVPRWGQKTEIAESALYLASDISSYVTGHVLVVDGGEWLVQQNFMPDMSKM